MKGYVQCRGTQYERNRVFKQSKNKKKNQQQQRSSIIFDDKNMQSAWERD